MLTLFDIKKRIEFHEGFRSEPYRCTQGKLTIGIGRCLDTNPLTEEEKKVIKNQNKITKQEAYFLLENDIKKVIQQLSSQAPCFLKLDDERRYALIDMCFQMGIVGLLKFKNMLQCMNSGDFNQASKECLDSNYAKQTPSRANRIARLIKNGVWKI